jgi:Zn-finger nucleic acid-binding protein
MVLWGLAPSARRPHGLPVHGCRSCGGAWIDANTLQVVLEAASARAPMEGHGVGDRGVRRRTMPPGTATAKVVYRKCPVCDHSMLRRNFARVSGVVVDECSRHGMFFDAGELEDILDFVRSGGLALAKRRDDDERASLERQRLSAAAMQAQSPGMGPYWMEGGYEHTDPSWAFVSWAGRWVRNLFK